MTQAWRAYGDLALLLAVPALLLGVGIYAWRRRTLAKAGEANSGAKATLEVLLLLNLIACAALILQPGYGSSQIDLVPFDGPYGDVWLLQSMGQVAVFFPAGLLARLRFGRPAALLLLVPGLFEGLQHLLSIGRAFTLDDVLLGTVGVFAGLMAAGLISRVLRVSSRPSVTAS